ncbi:hypothetical protein Agabi119p4_7033 [Agaricus bisporus var. burnettii]|uniref:F-box domain-containing protein n=1 Tax=Agaricus bisporus var. burnettii TaxID=192524 RepID=A0A8H7F0L9_AGABI|nr:hypothetical protein Agabi119p4_7033 [Agaricus bisporus var. burnettii]
MVQITPLNVPSPSPSQTDLVHSQTLYVLSSSQTKIRSLPFELLSTIFQHACPTLDISAENPIPMPPFHLVLRLVSTSWYDIVQSTPQFWATVLLPELCAENVDIKARYLKLYLDTSGGLPLTLSFRFDKSLREVGWFVSSIVDATLEHSAHRIKALRLSRPPRIWLEKLIPQMCQLATMHIDNPRPEKNWSPRRDERLFLPKSVNFRQIYLRCPCLLDFHLACPTPSLTHVDLVDCPIDFAMEFLLRCPNLIDFRCRCLLLYPLKVENPRTMFTSPLIRSRLSTLSWSTNYTRDGISEWDSVLFELIRFPSLERFHWWAGSCRVIVDDTILAFLSRIPKSISTLELAEVDMTFTDAILNHFLLLTGVTQLRLCRCSCFFCGASILCLLTRDRWKEHLISQTHVYYNRLPGDRGMDTALDGISPRKWEETSGDVANQD